MKKLIGIFNVKQKYISDSLKKKHNVIFFKGDGGELSIKEHKKKELYSLTDKEDATKLSSYISTKYGNDILIIDATTSLGGNFLSFSTFFNNIIGVEVNRIRFNKLLENFKNIKFQKKGNIYISENIILINDSFVTHLKYILDICNGYNKSVIFIDPPWGGKEYKKFDYLILGLHGIPMHKIIQYIKTKSNSTTVILKLPNNYLFMSFNTTSYKEMKMKKFTYLIFD